MTKFTYEQIICDGGRKRKVLLLGTCTIEAVTGGGSEKIGFDHYLFESFVHSPLPTIDIDDYDAVVVQPTLRHF